MKDVQRSVPTAKNKTIAVILALFFGFLGLFYVGWKRAMISLVSNLLLILIIPVLGIILACALNVYLAVSGTDSYNEGDSDIDLGGEIKSAMGTKKSGAAVVHVNKADALTKYHELLKSGVISKEEFATIKQSVLT